MRIVREEINKHESKLNSAPPRLSDAELEGISGGRDPLAEIYPKALKECCNRCDRFIMNHCGHSTKELARYILEHGDISSPINCPFH